MPRLSAAQSSGLLYHGALSRLAFAVSPRTSPTSSSSRLGSLTNDRMLMASPGSDLEQAALLTRTFTRAPAELCHPLALVGFVPAEAKTYAAMPETERQAVKAGYPVLA